GDAAIEEGMFLTRFASKITVIHRRGALRANKDAQQRAFANPKMHWVWNTIVSEVIGEDGQVSGVRTRDAITGEEDLLPTDGLFIYIGHEPNTAYLQGFVDLRPSGYVDVHDEIYTSREGVFAAGDVADEIYRQLGTSIGAGTRAAMAAEKWLAERAAGDSVESARTSETMAAGA
ncbi:MAG TPA: FAD-dependent oxidoreductase, partial [Trueperaceae bacterium]